MSDEPGARRQAKHLDRASFVVMAITVALFVAAFFAHGRTHDLLLEAGVLLVSVKLMLAGHKQTVAMEEELALLEKIEQAVAGPDAHGAAAAARGR